MPDATPALAATATRDPVGSVARGSALNILGAGASAVSTFGLTIALARGLDLESAGAFFATTSLFLLLSSLGQLGTGTGLVYFIAGDRAGAGPVPSSAYLRIAAGPVLAASAAGGVALVLAGPRLAAWLDAPDPGTFRAALAVLAVSMPVAAALNLCTAASRGLSTMRMTVVLDQVVRPLLQVVLVLLVLPTGSLLLVVVGWSLPYLPTAAGAWRWWRGHTRGDEAAPSAERMRARRLFWRFSAPRALAGAAQLAMQRFDVVLVGAMAGLGEAAIYAAATRFMVVGQLVGTSIGRAVQPRLAASLRRGDRETSARLYVLATGWLVMLAWPVYLVMGAFAGTLLSVFGSAYVDGATVLLVLCAAMVVASGCGMVDVVLTMAGKTSWNLANVLVAFAVNLGLDLLLIPQLGILGAAIGWAAAILCNNLLPLAQVGFVVRLHPFGRSTLLAMAVASGSFFVLPLLVRLVVGDGWTGLAASLAVGGAAYLLLCWRLRAPLALTTLWVSVRRSARPLG